MERIMIWYNRLSNRVKTSFTVSGTIIGFASTVLSIMGFSINEWLQNAWLSLLVVGGIMVVTYCLTYWIIGRMYQNSVSLIIRNTSISISTGDLFSANGWKLIPCDSHFDTRVDDIIISKKSLHGQLVLEHGYEEEIRNVVNKEAAKMNLIANSDGLYDFELGTVIVYNSSKDNNTYLMLAMTELDDKYEAHTNMATFERMLMRMWTEIDRVYASNDIVLPLLGTGISRFDDGPKDKEALLRCILCTLNGSGVSLNASVKIVLREGSNAIPLYEYKNMFKSFQGR